MTLFERRAARAIILTPTSDVLMMRMAFPWRDEDLWILPGGGIEPGETPEQAVEREIFEETGAQGLEIVGEAWRREVEIEATRTLLKQRYFLVRAARFEPQAGELLGAEQAWLKEYRWWSLPALRSAVDLRVDPVKIALGVERLLADGLPAAPIEIDHL